MENKIENKRCPTCGKKAHDFANEEALYCVPPKKVLQFGEYIINEKYRKALFQEFPFYTAEEIVGSYLGHNPYFPSQPEWLESKG